VSAYRAFATVAAWVASMVVLPSHAQTSDSETKASYLHKIAAFVEWPANAFEAPDSPLVLCIAGNDAVGRMADHAVSGRMYAMRPIVVRRIGEPSAPGRCHLLYVAGLSDDAVAGYLEAARDKPVLTVTDGANKRTRGVINFVTGAHRVRFEVDLNLAATQHLVVSSKLAALAARVLPP